MAREHSLLAPRPGQYLSVPHRPAATRQLSGRRQRQGHHGPGSQRKAPPQYWKLSTPGEEWKDGSYYLNSLFEFTDFLYFDGQI